MARQPRPILPGVALHIVQRGNDRADCFRRDGDYMLYLTHLRELADELGCAVHAYCLMTNHVHLLLTPPAADACATLMRNLGQRYVQRFNRAYERTGTLWEGRFRSFLVDSAGYVLACYRYIEQNPLRAGMVPAPSAYPWSSYHANAGLRLDPLVTPHPEYLSLSEDPARRQRAYRELVEGMLAQDDLTRIREAAQNGMPLGGEAFKARIEIGLGRRVGRIRPGRPKSGSGPNSLATEKLGSGPNFPTEEKLGPDPNFQMPL
ncbi:MAG TPA: transposase [Burkholderiales bacterium]|jgi:putative transposase|nr:transposase [Burkholderiales bacterium]